MASKALCHHMAARNTALCHSTFCYSGHSRCCPCLLLLRSISGSFSRSTMAPKKGKGGKDDQAAKEVEEAAKQQQAQLEAQRLQAEEQEKKKEAEEAAQKRQQEEAKRQQLAEQQRRKEEEDRRAKEDADRNLRDREREIQQLQLLEEKDKEINDLNEKVFAQNRGFVSTQGDLEGETKRAAHLSNELEVAQMKLSQFHSEVQRKEQEFLSNTEDMSQELDSLRTQLEVMKQVCETLIWCSCMSPNC